MNSLADTLQKPMPPRSSPLRPLALLMAFEAVTLAAVSVAHLTGSGGGSKPFRPDAAGATMVPILIGTPVALWRARARTTD